MSELHYCRVAVPETDGSEEERAQAFARAKKQAVSQVKRSLKKVGEDYNQGHHRVTMSMDSPLERASVIAEWWPYE